MKYNKSEIMKRAWEIFRSERMSFSTALKRAWSEAKAKMNKNLLNLGNFTAEIAKKFPEDAEIWNIGVQEGKYIVFSENGLRKAIDLGENAEEVSKAAFFVGTKLNKMRTYIKKYTKSKKAFTLRKVGYAKKAIEILENF